jgi:hypothetical protein
MSTYRRMPRFDRDYASLTSEQRHAFKRTLVKLIADLKAGRSPRPGLRVKRVQQASGVFELTWAPDGRATFEYGEPVREGETHIVWRRIGTHDVLDEA